VKWVGAFILITAAALLGHLYARERERRVRHLETLIHSLELLETEVVYGLAYLVDACRRVASDQAECRSLYAVAATRMIAGAPAGAAWQSGVRALLRQSALSEEDVRPLEMIGSVLGQCSADDQKRHLRLARRQINVRLAEARERLPQVARLWRTLGLCAGVAIALLLI